MAPQLRARTTRPDLKATTLFVDTWGWLALEDRRDPAHERAAQVRQDSNRLGILWHTTDYILDETFTQLFQRRPFVEASTYCRSLLASQEQGYLVIQSITPPRFAEAFRLRLRLQDKPRISFTDLTSFVVMQELGISRVLTGDAHFRQVNLGFEIVP